MIQSNWRVKIFVLQEPGFSQAHYYISFFLQLINQLFFLI